jgi:hypothetical protein
MRSSGRQELILQMGVTLQGNESRECDRMATDPPRDDDQRQAHDQTEYAPKSASGSKPGFVLSAWALAVGAVALVIVISGLLMI